MSGSRERPEPPGFEIPDLDLPPPNRSQSAMRAVTPPASGQARVAPPPEPVIHDELGEALGGAALDLDLGGPISSGSAYNAFQGPEKDFMGGGLDLESVLPEQSGKLTVAPEHRANAPLGVTPQRERLVLDPLEVRLLAGFGEPPSFGPLLIAYAFRVVLRKRVLLRELHGVQAELAQAEKRRDDVLADLAAELRPALASDERYARLFEPLGELDALAGERGANIAAIEREKAAEAAQIEAERAPLTHAMKVESARQDHCREELDSKAAVLERAEARHKRDLIEIRAVEDQAAQRLGPQGGDMPADLVARLLPLKSRAEGSRQDLADARAEHDTLKKEHDAGQQRLRELARRDEKLNERARDSAKRFQQRLGARAEGMSDATSKQRAALADVGRGILAASGSVPMSPETLKSLAQADTEVAALSKRAETHLRALDAADAAKVSSGFAWLGALVALIVAYWAYRSF